MTARRQRTHNNRAHMGRKKQKNENDKTGFTGTQYNIVVTELSVRLPYRNINNIVYVPTRRRSYYV